MQYEVFKGAKRIKTINTLEAKDIAEAAKLAGLTEPKFPAGTSTTFGNFAWQWFTAEDGTSYAMEVIEVTDVKEVIEA